MGIQIYLILAQYIYLIINSTKADNFIRPISTILFIDKKSNALPPVDYFYILFFAISLVKLAGVPLPVGKYQHSLPLHLILRPSTLVYLSVRPLIPALSTHLIILEGALVAASIGEKKEALAVFFALSVVAGVLRSIRPRLLALPMPQIPLPVALIRAALRMLESPKPVRHIIEPVALVRVPVRMYHFAKSIGLVIRPVTLVQTTIGPYLLSVPVLFASQELPGVLGIVAHDNVL